MRKYLIVFWLFISLISWGQTLTKRNTVGVINVTPISYLTNNNPTTVTVGASGATYTSLITAYNASSGGDVIEIIDDTITLTAQFTMTKPYNGSREAIKIKGKSTKSMIITHNVADPIRLALAGASIEFENIIFKENNGNVPYKAFSTTTDGFSHFINCVFDGGQHINGDSHFEFVFDSVSFINQVDTEVLYFYNAASLINSKAIFNNVSCSYSSIATFITLSKPSGNNLSKISITNSDIYVTTTLLFGTNTEIDTLDIRGNLIGTVSGYAIGNIGLEAVGSDIAETAAYNSGTAYTVGERVDYTSNLWECTSNTTGNAPTKTSSFWKVAEIITGTIEQNTIYRTTYITNGHGIFLGFGAYNFSVKNNIVSNYWYNYVIKGVNNKIMYNCAGEGFRGFSIFANNQDTVSNNTSRTEDDYGLQVNVQSTGGTGVDSTIIRDNIFTTVPTGDVILLINGSTGNTYNQNILYGDAPLIQYNATRYTASNATDFNNYKTVSGDANGLFLNPTYSGTDPLTESYYKPTNSTLLSLRDENSQAIGAIDYIFDYPSILLPIDNYVADTTMEIWSIKINDAIYNYTGSTDTISLGVDSFNTWWRKTNTFISDVPENATDTIIYPDSDTFEQIRTKFNNAVNSANN